MRVVGLLFISSLVLFPKEGFTQCNTTFERVNDTIYFGAEPEALHPPVDETSSEYQAASISLTLFVRKDEEWALMQLFSSAHNAQAVVIPRNIEILFQDGSVFKRRADEINTPGKKFTNMDHTSFELSIEDTDELMEPIQRIKIWDHRTGKEALYTPYPDILYEQMQCIGKRIEVEAGE